MKITHFERKTVCVPFSPGIGMSGPYFGNPVPDAPPVGWLGARGAVV